tara:strand:- start:434 stop:1708 length:1275 start_codon:yes stop_codon:yes gene_type:complete
MKEFLIKLLKNKKKTTFKEISFKNIQKETKISKIFDAINSFNDESEIRYVGGCVRKILSGENFDDIDLATNLKPSDVKIALEKNSINFFETGVKHGTITAQIEKKNFEITSLRKDVTTDGRHALVEFTKDWKEDSFRRDFSINSIYSDEEGNLFDPCDGVKDLKDGVIKFVGKPEHRIKEDYLRILRYLRFFVNYSKKDHDPEVKKVIKQNIGGIINLSKERLIEELMKLVLSSGFINIFKHNFSQDLLLLIFPQLKNLNIFKKLNKYSRSILYKKDFIFLLALLIIDETDNADYFLYKYKVSNETKKRVSFLKDFFGKNFDKKNFSIKNLEFLFYYHGKSNLIDLIDFYLLRYNKSNKKIIHLRSYFEKKEKPIFPVKTKDIMKKYNLKESRELGQKLKKIEKVWVQNSFKISDNEIEKIFLN